MHFVWAVRMFYTPSPARSSQHHARSRRNSAGPISMAEAAAKKLINEPDNVVDEAIDGLVLTTPGVRRLEGYTVLVRENLDKSKVAVVSGGGSGHEPSHGGWVGEGMLSAAVPGAVFASPSTASVLAAILHVTGAGGCLVIVKNYTGDRLNFGLACEQAKAAGLKVEMLVVGDDCALPHRTGGLAGRRGVAGTVLVHKVAGAAAEAGLSLEQARRAAPSTLAIALFARAAPLTHLTAAPLPSR